MTDQVQIPEDDEISLLDLLQTIVDNLRLLVLGPLAVGLAALGISKTPALVALKGSDLSQRTLYEGERRWMGAGWDRQLLLTQRRCSFGTGLRCCQRGASAVGSP